VNPWHEEGMARALDRALRMPLEERRDHYAKLSAVVQGTTAVSWAEDFLSALERCRVS
jgi:trehalose 6-phosphate synthase